MTPEQRKELQSKLAINVIEGMELVDLIGYAIDQLERAYETLTDAQFQEELEQFAPYLIDEE